MKGRRKISGKAPGFIIAAFVISVFWSGIRMVGYTAAQENVYVKRAAELFQPGTSKTKKIQLLTELGKSGKTAADALPAINSVIADVSEDIMVRGYAVWAREAINPHAVERRTYHVAQENPAAGDQNPGTAELPWKTVQKAAETLRPGDTVLIHSGVYREFVQPFLGGTGYDCMITYRAAPGERPILKGSDIWQPEWKNEGPRLWSAAYQRHPWDYPEKWHTPKFGPMHRAEQVFVDGKLLIHVESIEKLRGLADTFYTDDTAHRLWISLGDDRPPNQRTIERSVRQQVFAPAVRGLGYIKVIGLTLQHAAAPEMTGNNWDVIGHRAMMSVRTGHHWIIKDNTIEWGNAQGLDIGGAMATGDYWPSFNPPVPDPIVSADGDRGYHQVRRNQVNYQGVAGIVGAHDNVRNCVLHCVLEDNITNYNCQKGNFYDAEAAGIKFHWTSDLVIRRHTAIGNKAFGVWLDCGNERVRISQCILLNNVGAGTFIEASQGPVLVDNNVITGNRDPSCQQIPGWEWADGCYSHDSCSGFGVPKPTATAVYINNYLANNAGHGVCLRNSYGRTLGGFPTSTSRNRIWNNFIFDNGRDQISFNPAEPTGFDDNRSDKNSFWNFGKPVTMRFINEAGGGGFPGVKWETTAIGKLLGWTGVSSKFHVPISAWQQGCGLDVNSVMVNPTSKFSSTTPSVVLNSLKSWWPANYPALDAGYGEVTSPF